MLSNLYCGALTIGLAFGFGYVALSASTPQAQTEGNSWELSASHLQAAGLHLPSYMPRVENPMLYQSRLSTHQELEIEWNLIPGSDRPVRRDGVAEGSLSSNFILQNRKQNVQGNARASMLDMNDLTLVTIAITPNGEVRGLTVGPGTPRIPGESFGGKTSYEMVNPKTTFQIFLPDDPKVEKLVFLLAHPDGAKYRLEKVGTLDLSSKKPTA
jgi:hypothetical protein